MTAPPPLGDLALSIESEPRTRDLAALDRGLDEHSLPITGSAGFRPLAVFLRDPSGRLVGGAAGRVNWNWLHVARLWVTSDLRRRGLGARLLRTLEAAAIERGCRQAHLETFSFQALPFYEAQGYEVFGVLEDYPPDHQRYFVRKKLEPGAGR